MDGKIDGDMNSSIQRLPTATAGTMANNGIVIESLLISNSTPS